MQFKKFTRLGSITLFLALTLLNPLSYADERLNEIDTIRAELSCISDKNSPYYIKTKQKLEKLIIKNKLNYTDEARLHDALRLIQEQKYNSAIYELNELINNAYQISKCNELLGDISQKLSYPAKKTAHYYKLALQYDRTNIDATYKLAKLYLKEKKNILAIENLKQVVNSTQDCNLLKEIEDLISNKIMPQNRYETNNLYEILAEIYLKLGQKEQALEAYSKAIQVNTKDIFLKYYLSGLLYESNNDNHALVLLDSILSQNPDDTQIKTIKAKILAKKGDIAGAEEQYREILNIYPTSKQAKYGIYKLYENRINPEEIIKRVYYKKQNYNPNLKDIVVFADFLEEMEDLRGAQDFRNYAKNIQETERKKALLKQEELKKAQEAKILKEQENKKLEQEKSLKQKIQTKQKIKRETQPKQQIQQEKLENQKAQQEAQTKQKAQQDALKKQQALEKEKIKQAKTKKEKELKEYEKRAIEYERKKAIAKNPKKYQELKATADKFLSANPMTSQNYIAAANTYKQMGEPTSALLYYKEAMKLDPTNSDIYYNLGLTYFELNSEQSAKANLIKAINLDSDNTKAKNLLAFVNQKIITKAINEAYSYYEKKEYVKAFETLEKELKNYPQNSQLYYYRGLIYQAMNRNSAAISDFQKATEYDPSNYMSYYQLGKTYEKIGEERDALVAYEKFLSTEPDEKELVSEIEKKVITLGEKYY